MIARVTSLSEIHDIHCEPLPRVPPTPSLNGSSILPRAPPSLSKTTPIRRLTRRVFSNFLQDPLAPAEFDDFQVENLKLAEFDQTENFRMPSLTSDALTMVATKFPRFTARRYDLYEFRRSSNTADFELAERLAISSDTADDRYPWLSDDGLQLIFTSNRDPLGNKLYCSWRNGLDQPWQGPIPYGQIPEAAVLTHDFSASLVGGELYFVRVYPGERRSEFVRAVR